MKRCFFEVSAGNGSNGEEAEASKQRCVKEVRGGSKKGHVREASEEIDAARHGRGLEADRTR